MVWLRLHRILMVCHCYREKDDIIRIISARKATAKEQHIYMRNRKGRENTTWKQWSGDETPMPLV